jgi:hypothetical protein
MGLFQHRLNVIERKIKSRDRLASHAPKLLDNTFPDGCNLLVGSTSKPHPQAPQRLWLTQQ